MQPSADPHSSAEQYDGLRSQVASSLARSLAHKNKLKKADQSLSIASLVLGAIATFIAGQSAVSNNPIAGNWRSTAAIASVCTLGATLTTGIHKQIVPTDLLVEASECTAQLKVLAIETAGDVYDVETAKDTYRRLIAEFSKLDF